MTRPDIDAILARAEAATKGPWRWESSRNSCHLNEDGICDADGNGVFVNCGRIAGEPNDADRDFLVASRADIPALCQYVRELEEELEQLKDAVAEKAIRGIVGAMVDADFDVGDDNDTHQAAD